MDVTVVHLINVEVQQLQGMGQVPTACMSESVVGSSRECMGSIYTHVRGELEVKWCE